MAKADNRQPKHLTAAGGTATLNAAPLGDDGQPSGGPPRISINAYNGSLFRPARPYLPYPVAIDLAGLARPTDPIAILLDHWDETIVGQSTEVQITASKIDVEGIITGDIDETNDPAHKVIVHAKNGFIWKASVGVEIERLEEIEAGVVVSVNGRQIAGPCFIVRGGQIDEVSLLSIAADRSTSAKVAARRLIDALSEYESSG